MKTQDTAIQKIQAELLSLYKSFAEICEQNGLRYYAIQGTTVGAIFWDKIVPWDDDMDLGMPAEDYEKFLKIAASGKLPDSLHFLEFPWYGGKLFSEKTTFIEPAYLLRPKLYHGVYIDVVPLVGLPDNPKKREKYQKKMEEYHIEAWNIDRYPEAFNKIQIAKLEHKRQKFLNAYKFGSTKYITDFSFGFYYQFKTEGFVKPIIHKFHDTTIPISSTYDYDLKSRYKVYMKFPPEESRAPHNSLAFTDFNKSYLFYERELKDCDKWIAELIKKNVSVERNYYLANQKLKKTS